MKRSRQSSCLLRCCLFENLKNQDWRTWDSALDKIYIAALREHLLKSLRAFNRPDDCAKGADGVARSVSPIG